SNGASSAALTVGKRLSQDLYLSYERSLSGALGTLYIFYDLSRHLTLRAQTGEKAALDMIYTRRFD
ncbi:MAG: translocation/assembly module TamB domain-containing protein, partial [Giesbergeria sp.]